MNWFFEDIKRAYQQLCQWQTWLAIGLMGMFFGLAYLVSQFAFRTDSILVFLHRTASSCREMNNGSIIFMFCGMIFFALAAIASMGELQRYFEFRQYGARFEARTALRGGIFWSGVAIVIAVGALVFFAKFCA